MYGKYIWLSVELNTRLDLFNDILKKFSIYATIFKN